MIAYIKQNKWLIIIISIITINIGWMIYSHKIDKNTIQLEENRYTLGQKTHEENREEKVADGEEKYVVQPVEISVEGHDVSAEVPPSTVEVLEVEEVPIYICGEVRLPGVYYVPTDAIINDVIEKCGGFTDEANPIAINLASSIVPNEKIIVPKLGEEIDKLTDSYDNRGRIESNSVSPQAAMGQDTLINLNTATKDQLMTLNGIGEVKAAAIIDYRQEKGIFNSVEEIKNISGIGEKTFEKIKQFITT